MDYKKMYKDALERAKDYHKQLLDEDNSERAGEIEVIFPELKESEDEKIRKKIISAVNLYCNSYCEGEKVRENMLAWFKKQHLKDGVYYVCDDKTVVPYKAEVTAPEGTMGVLLVQGERSVIVALHDCKDGEKIKLTKRSDPTNLKGNYIDEYIDAVADWNGQQNTKHLKAVGLCEKINLNDDWYIPSMGEMLFIFTHKKEVNAALEKAGGQPISYDWYWTSTEYNAEMAWIIDQHYSSISFMTKTANECMRLVSSFTTN